MLSDKKNYHEEPIRRDSCFVTRAKVPVKSSEFLRVFEIVDSISFQTSFMHYVYNAYSSGSHYEFVMLRVHRVDFPFSYEH